jgi:hypothetical protein
VKWDPDLLDLDSYFGCQDEERHARKLSQESCFTAAMQFPAQLTENGAFRPSSMHMGARVTRVGNGCHTVSRDTNRFPKT